MFQKWVLALLCCSLVMFQTDVIARGGGGSSFRSSSSSFRSSSPSVAKTVSVAKTTSTFSAPSQSASAKPVAVANTKLSNTMAIQDAMVQEKLSLRCMKRNRV